MINEIIGGVIGLILGCGYIVAYFVGRLHQMHEDDREAHRSQT